MYKVLIDRDAVKSLAKLPKKVQRQIAGRIDSLKGNPRPAGCEPIKGIKNIFRIKSGPYRISYQIRNKKLIILVVRIGHRKDFYQYYDS